MQKFVILATIFTLFTSGCVSEEELAARRALVQANAYSNYYAWLTSKGGNEVYDMKTASCTDEDSDRNGKVSCEVLLKANSTSKPEYLFHECPYQTDNRPSCRVAAQKIIESEEF